jgi:hypothetical protein
VRFSRYREKSGFKWVAASGNSLRYSHTLYGNESSFIKLGSRAGIKGSRRGLLPKGEANAFPSERGAFRRKGGFPHERLACGVRSRGIGVNLSSNAYPTDVFPPLVPPWKGGKKKSNSLPNTYGEG